MSHIRQRQLQELCACTTSTGKELTMCGSAEAVCKSETLSVTGSKVHSLSTEEDSIRQMWFGLTKKALHWRANPT
jgi:hypothetical protein